MTQFGSSSPFNISFNDYDAENIFESDQVIGAENDMNDMKTAMDAIDPTTDPIDFASAKTSWELATTAYNMVVLSVNATNESLATPGDATLMASASTARTDALEASLNRALNKPVVIIPPPAEPPLPVGGERPCDWNSDHTIMSADMGEGDVITVTLNPSINKFVMTSTTGESVRELPSYFPDDQTYTIVPN